MAFVIFLVIRMRLPTPLASFPNAFDAHAVVVHHGTVPMRKEVRIDRPGVLAVDAVNVGPCHVQHLEQLLLDLATLFILVGLFLFLP